MHWELSDEQELFADSLREWISTKYSTSKVRAALDAESSPGPAFTASLVSEGWWGVGYSEDTGGQGGGLLEQALAAREFGRAAVPDAGWLAAAVATPALTDRERAGQATGDTVHVLACRSDRAPVPQPLTLSGNAVSGTVPHVLAGDSADVFLVAVTGPDGPGLARVAAEHAMLEVDHLLDRSRTTATVEFTAAPVLDIQPVRPGLFDEAATVAAVLVAADALGAAERMLDLSVEYSKQRKQFGRVIGAFQAVKHAAAQMLVTVEAGYSAALYAAAAVDARTPDADVAAAVAKAQVGATVADLADSALTVHGAIGYTWEHDLQLFYKRAKLDRVLFGAPSVWNERIARAVLAPVG